MNLAALVLMALTAVTLMGCQAGESGRRVVPSYDSFTSRLVQLAADQNGDGRLDQWSYLDGGAPLRGEADTDGDSRIDRWEYFDAQARLVRVGTSSASDGVEDTWTFTVPVNGEGQIAHSRKRDRAIDRREYFNGTVLLRVEEDTNADGRTDKWERYEGPIRREVAFDTTFQAQRPNRRLVYDAGGRFERIESDPDGDGVFTPLASGAGSASESGAGK